MKRYKSTIKLVWMCFAFCIENKYKFVHSYFVNQIIEKNRLEMNNDS